MRPQHTPSLTPHSPSLSTQVPWTLTSKHTTPVPLILQPLGDIDFNRVGFFATTRMHTQKPHRPRPAPLAPPHLPPLEPSDAQHCTLACDPSHLFAPWCSTEWVYPTHSHTRKTHTHRPLRLWCAMWCVMCCVAVCCCVLLCVVVCVGLTAHLLVCVEGTTLQSQVGNPSGWCVGWVGVCSGGRCRACGLTVSFVL